MLIEALFPPGSPCGCRRRAHLPRGYGTSIYAVEVGSARFDLSVAAQNAAQRIVAETSRLYQPYRRPLNRRAERVGRLDCGEQGLRSAAARATGQARIGQLEIQSN
jgi:hypothetical protein